MNGSEEVRASGALWRSLRHLAGGVVLFALPLAALGVMVEAGLRRVPNTYSAKQEALDQRAAEVEVLVLGPSGAQLGVNPQVFQVRGYNAANASQSLYYDTQIVSRNWERLPRLRLVLVGLHYISLKFNLGASPEYWRQFLYQRFMRIPPERPLDPLDSRAWSLSQLYGPRKSVDMALSGFQASLAAGDENGWVSFTGQGARYDDDHGRARLATHHALMQDGNLAANLAHLRQTLALLRTRGVAAALIILPVHPIYAAHARPGELALLQDTSRALGAEFAVPVRDYFADSRIPPEEFGDLDHLAAPGAVRFSRILDEEVVRPALGR